MKTFGDWLDEAKQVTGSDYRTAKILGITRQRISQLRAEKKGASNKICLGVAEILGVSPLEIIASVECEKEPENSKNWQKYLTSAAAILSVVVFANLFFDSNAYAFSLTDKNIHYAQLLAALLMWSILYFHSKNKPRNGSIFS